MVNVPSPIDGLVRIVAREDTIVHVGDLIAQIGTKEELASAPQDAQPKQQSQTKQQQPQAKPQQQQGVAVQPQANGVMAAPYVRKLARDLNIDLSKVVGTGPNGRILETT